MEEPQGGALQMWVKIVLIAKFYFTFFQLEDILPPSPEDTPRPSNAPPSYEDAMRFVTEAFSLEDSEEENDEEETEGRPPKYSPLPKEGEQVIFESLSSVLETESPDAEDNNDSNNNSDTEHEQDIPSAYPPVYQRYQ